MPGILFFLPSKPSKLKKNEEIIFMKFMGKEVKKVGSPQDFKL